jgi:hypothetical protein
MVTVPLASRVTRQPSSGARLDATDADAAALRAAINPSASKQEKTGRRMESTV